MGRHRIGQEVDLEVEQRHVVLARRGHEVLGELVDPAGRQQPATVRHGRVGQPSGESQQQQMPFQRRVGLAVERGLVVVWLAHERSFAGLVLALDGPRQGRVPPLPDVVGHVVVIDP